MTAVHSAAMTDATSVALRTGRPPVAALASGLVCGALIAFVPSVDPLPYVASARPALTVRLVLVLIAVAVGMPVLVRLAWQGDRTARVAVAFTLWAALAALVSGSPLAWTGEFATGTGAVFVGAVAGCWAIGRALPRAAGSSIAVGFLAGAAVNAAVAVLQGVADLSGADLPLFHDRSTGLLGNPVFLGSACAAAMAFVRPVLRRLAPAGFLLVALLAAAVQMSGARAAFVLLVVVGGWAARGSGRRLGALVLIAVVVGSLVGGALQDNAGAAAAARVQDSGPGPRLQYWGAGVRAAIDRPVAGYGPGRWRAATSPYRTLEVVRAGGPDRLYADAHNLPVEYLVTTGLVGLALLLAWLALVVRDVWRPARPDAAVAAGTLLAVHMVEPQHVVLTPIMLLLAAVAGSRRDPGPSRWGVVATVLLGVLALVAGGRVLTGDLLYRRAELDFDLDRMQTASALLWPWPNPVSAESRIHAYQARTLKKTSELEAAVDAARRARVREPGNPIRTIAVASLLSQLGRHEAAAAEFARALQLDPWSKLALLGRATALEQLDRAAQGRACRAATDITRSDRVLQRDRSRCVSAPDAKRERP